MDCQAKNGDVLLPLVLPRIGLPVSVILPRPVVDSCPSSIPPSRRGSCQDSWPLPETVGPGSDFAQTRTSFESCTVSPPDNCDELLRFRG